tara:strand:+ start:1023 stop:1265 length:243 start_codon:yes stop_codon:yes gene_type:complete
MSEEYVSPYQNVTRADKIEKVLDYWEEGWYANKLQDAFNEFRELYRGDLHQLTKWDIADIDAQYEEALYFFNHYSDKGQE